MCNAVLISCPGHPFWLKVNALHTAALSPLPPTPQVVDELVHRNSREDAQDWGVRAMPDFGLPVFHCCCIVGQVLKLTGPVLVQDVLHANG